MGQFGEAALDTSTIPCAKKVHWVEVELVGKDNKPVAWEKYSIARPDREISEGRLDGFGWVRIDGIAAPGTCQISFPDLDDKVWTTIEATGPRGAAGPHLGKARDTSWWPDAGSSISVKDGQCCTSVAYKEGHHWETIWDAPENKQLRNRRDDPNCLLEGDALFIPALKLKKAPGATDQRHRFRFETAAKLVIRLLLPDGKARAGAKYELEAGDVKLSDTTKADGIIRVDISPQVTEGKLKVHGEASILDQVFNLRIGTLDPQNETSGVRQRLRNLGTRQLLLDDVTVVKGFQRSMREPMTGKPADIADKLRDQHGS